MIWSKYNHLFKSKKHGFLLYNALSNAFIQIPEDSISYFYQIQEHPDTIEEYKESEYFKEYKILVDNDEDELNVLKVSEYSGRYSPLLLSLTIAPTLACNFRCSYCYEPNKQSIYMGEKVQTAIIEHIKKRNYFQHISVTWYGGEPLLCIDTIENLTKQFLQLNIGYDADIVTNGYLLSVETFKKLQDLQISSIQITLDGLPKTHNLRRPHATNNNSFERITDNIDGIIPIKKNINISIRVNIDKNNKEEFPLLYKLLTHRYGDNVYIYPAFVENLNNTCNTNDCMQDTDQTSTYLIDLYNKHGIYDQRFFPRLTTSTCMARFLHSYVIDPCGKLYKCWNDIGIEEKIVADIVKDEITNQKLLARYLKGADKTDSMECNDCFLFPACSGGCPYHRIQHAYHRRIKDFCHIAKNHLEELLEIHYEYKMTH